MVRVRTNHHAACKNAGDISGNAIVGGNVDGSINNGLKFSEQLIMEQDFIIDKASWHTQKIRDYPFDNSVVYEYFKNIFLYLEENGLTEKRLSEMNMSISDETCLRKSDLTEEGFAVIKAAYGKWTDKVVDKQIKPTNFKLLNKALTKVRQK